MNETLEKLMFMHNGYCKVDPQEQEGSITTDWFPKGPVENWKGSRLLIVNVGVERKGIDKLLYMCILMKWLS